MNIKSVYSNKNSIEDVVKDIKEQLGEFDVKLLIFFASSRYDSDKVSKLMQEGFLSSTVFGCSTAGEIISGKMLKNSLVAMVFNSEVIDDVKVEVIKNIREDGDAKETFKSFDNYFNERFSEVNCNKYIGILLIDGLSASEEKIMDKIGDQTNCAIIGGSAGDDLKFSSTNVYANGVAYTNAAILTMIKFKTEFDIIKTQSFTILDKKLIATKVDLATRKVIEFDNKPAIEAYADALGIQKSNAADYFFSNPTGLIADGEIFVRSPQQIADDGIIFYCNILEGMEVSLLQSKNIIIDTKKAIENKISEMGTISGIINFHCILRTLELEQKNQTEAYGKIFSDIPTIGFSTYGEEYLGHINQTSTMLVFK